MLKSNIMKSISFLCTLLLFSTFFSPSNAESTQDPFIYPPEKTYFGTEVQVDPYKEIILMQKKLGSLLDAVMRESYMKTYSTSPALDFQDLGDRFVAKLDMPGIDKEAINVEIDEKTLTVSGDRLEVSEESDSSGYYRKERSSSSFKRVISLPSEVKADQVDAKYENGVLTLTLPKLSPNVSNSTKIEVK